MMTKLRILSKIKKPSKTVRVRNQQKLCQFTKKFLFARQGLLICLTYSNVTTLSPIVFSLNKSLTKSN